MQVWLFDTSPTRKAVWLESCQKQGIELKCYGQLCPELYQTPDRSRLVVLDQIVVGDLYRTEELIGRLKFDVVTFTVLNINCELTMRLISFGARWVFNSNSLQSELNSCLFEVLKLRQELDQKFQRYKYLSELSSSVSPKEGQVLNSVMEGLTNKQIAKQLEVSVRTIEARRARIYEKYAVQSIVELVRRVDELWALEQVFRLDP